MIEFTNDLINITKFKEISSEYDWLQNAHIKVIYITDYDKNIWSEGYKENKRYPNDDNSFIISLKKSVKDIYISINDYIELIKEYELLKKYIHTITFEYNRGIEKLTIDKSKSELINKEYNDCRILNIQWKGMLIDE